MKIGLISMSGVRVVNEELLRAGLNLPGFVERSKVIASLPSLSLLTLAGMTPEDFEVEYREVAELREAESLPEDYDLVAISTFSAQSLDSYAIADRYLARGVPVVIGGLHATALPEEAALHATSVCVGEGELVWPRVLEDLRRGRLAPRYSARPGERFDLGAAPMPRWELLDLERYNRLTVQTSRGCPHQCHFCASSILLVSTYAVKPVPRVISEIRRIRDLWERPFIEFADDNSFVHRRHAKELLRALADEGVHWFTEADISIAKDAELLDLMRESGCRQVLVGLESPRPEGLDGLEMKRNWKLRQLGEYERAVHAIQSRGITVNGCFILGLDGHTPEIFDRVYDFVERSGLYEVQVTVQTPFPGTPLYERLRAEGRILEDGAWNLCTLFDVNYEPRGMTAADLRRGIIELCQRLYAPEFVRARRERFFSELRRNRVAAPAQPPARSA